MPELSLRFAKAEVEQLRAVLGTSATKGVVRDVTAMLARHTTAEDGASRMMAALKPGSEVTAETVLALRQAVQQHAARLQQLLPVLGEEGTHTTQLVQELQQAEEMLAGVEQHLGSVRQAAPGGADPTLDGLAESDVTAGEEAGAAEPEGSARTPQGDAPAA